MGTIHVVGAAIMEGNKVLAAQRSSKMDLPLKWEFVGGKVEEGETHPEALEREVFEELDIKIKVNGFLASSMIENKGKRMILHVYEALMVEGTPKNKEHEKIEWVEVDGLMKLDWAEADLPACQQLLKRYGKAYAGKWR